MSPNFIADGKSFTGFSALKRFWFFALNVMKRSQRQGLAYFASRRLRC